MTRLLDPRFQQVQRLQDDRRGDARAEARDKVMSYGALSDGEEGVVPADAPGASVSVPEFAGREARCELAGLDASISSCRAGGVAIVRPIAGSRCRPHVPKDVR